MEFHLNIAHSKFDEQFEGLMICGYEWGYSKKDQENEQKNPQASFYLDAGCTFANKELCYGPSAKTWRYDNNVIKWFRLWGHPLDQEKPSCFERSIIQTNWCNTQDHSIGDVSYFSKLTAAEQIANFIAHVRYFKPRIIMFMGSQLSKYPPAKPGALIL